MSLLSHSSEIRHFIDSRLLFGLPESDDLRARRAAAIHALTATLAVGLGGSRPLAGDLAKLVVEYALEERLVTPDPPCAEVSARVGLRVLGMLPGPLEVFSPAGLILI
jgi:hypothetical protein